MSSPHAGNDFSVERSSEVPPALNSSPQRPPRSDSGKERRNPSVTPRKFKRFFTPRTQPPQQEKSRRVLFNIDRPNRHVQSSPLLPSQYKGQENDQVEFPRDLKRQKISHIAEAGTGYAVSHSKEIGFVGGRRSEGNGERIQSSPCPQGSSRSFGTDGTSDEDIEQRVEPGRPSRANPEDLVKPIVRWTQHGGLSAQLLSLSLGNTGRPGRFHHSYPINDWRDHTGNFYSGPEDVHDVQSLEEPERRTIPFIALGLNKTSLIAVGDEEGRVRLLESNAGGHPEFQKSLLGFRVHTNAIIDMSFSDDDALLATASGDQSARVVDMLTQTTIAILGIHTASLKQVRFQPGANNNSVLATSGRDGSIHLWDLRCKGYDGPQCRMWTPVVPHGPSGRPLGSNDQDVMYPRASSSIPDAHKPLPGLLPPPTAGCVDVPARGEASSNSEALGRTSDISVTALQFLHGGLDHLLLSACEADASVKLWDIRAVSSRRRTLPLSTTALPPWHLGYRNFGISSLNLSSDGARFYTLCKDNIVYAYSTSHLMLGHAPELEVSNNSRPSQTRETQEGQGPLYGFRNSKFHANTFYVKSALRNTKNGHSELLAVGSSDECAVLFPTDERYLRNPSLSNDAISVKQQEFGCHPMPTCPIYDIGTALVRGHDREVGSVTWTNQGELATVGDDLIVRCWREDYQKAKDLRTGGEDEGRRWRCGWANVKSDYDDDDMEC
ncbi:hypothetical protein EG329_005428 [Mollisiaceae sp. DMI_Dod_QoI]|nr:hypothetical protein EG329_005428 [Helotiales sp. DMI_Dod_QoI]